MWNEWSVSKRISLVIGIGVIIGIMTWLLIWAYGSNKKPLFTGLSDQDAGAVITELENMDVNYDLSNNGSTVLVDENIVHETRLKLTENGVALKNSTGFEIFDKAEYGMTEFVQKINYQRAMEGELSRTINALDAVKHSRVHLVIPENQLFSHDKQLPKAAITLIMHNGQSLDVAQISGIQRLVAASVTKLSAENVTISNERGVVISKSIDKNGELFTNKLTEKQNIEKYYQNKIHSIIDQVAGIGMGVVNVNVNFNYDKVVKTTEKVLTAENDKTRGVMTHIKKTTSKQENRNKNSDKDKKATGNQLLKETVETQYQVGKEIEQVNISAGRIDNISVSVLLPQNVSDESLLTVQRLVQASIGFKGMRGDQVEVKKLDYANSSVSPQVINGDDIAESVIEPVGIPAIEDEKQNRTRESIMDRVNDNPLFLIVILLLIIGVLILLLRGWLSGRSSSERDAALADIRQWLKQNNESAVKGSVE